MSTSLNVWEIEGYLYHSIEKTLAEDHVSEEDLDEAFEMALEVKDPFKQTRYLSDIASKYLTFPSLRSHKKASDIAMGLRDQINVEGLLQRIIRKCREMEDANAITIANRIEQQAQGIFSRLKEEF